MSSGHAAYHHSTTAMFGRGAERQPSQLGGTQAWAIWVLATVFVVWLFAIQTGYGIVSERIQEDAGLSISEVAFAASIYTWAFAVSQFFSGSLLDRYGTRPLLTVAVALVTIGACLYANTASFGTLVVAQVVLAIGSSFGFVGAGYVGGKWFESAKYGLMFGLVQMCASLGSALGQPLISAQLEYMSWRQLLTGFGAFGALLTIAFALLVHNPAGHSETEQPAPAAEGRNVFVEIAVDLKACLLNVQVLLSALFAGASFGTMLAVGVLWGPRVQEARGASPGFAAVLSALAWLGLAVGAPLVNVVSNHWHSRKRPSVIGLGLQAIAVALFIYLPPSSGQAVSAVVMFAVGVLAGAHMLGFTIAGESVPPHLIGSAAAIVNGVCFIVGGLLVALPGHWLPAGPALGDYQAALWIMPLTLVVGTACAAALRERHQAAQSPHDEPRVALPGAHARAH